MRRVLALITTLALGAAGTATAAPVHRSGSIDQICGTERYGMALSHARHRLNQRRLAGEKPSLPEAAQGLGAAATAAGPTVEKRKNIAVVEDDGSIILPANSFDLGRTGVQFRRSGPGMRGERFGNGVSATRGERIELGDDDSRAIDLPFNFRFYGTVHRRVFLNSDGNLTFVRSESFVPRSLGQLVGGSPRIAPFFADLDPSQTSGEDGVYLLREGGRVRITWWNVPRFGATDSNTFQVTLFPGGRVTFAYGEMAATEGVVGVAPGSGGLVHLLDYSAELPLGRQSVAIAETFRDLEVIDDVALARAVLTRVRDEYGHLVVFAGFPVSLDGAFAFELTVKNDVAGIGDGIFDFSDVFGSGGRLESYVQLGSLENYPGNPNSRIFAGGPATGKGVAAHEFGHRWLAKPTFRDDSGNRSTALLGRALVHWSFLFDTDGSVMEGNDIRDNGDGSFTTVGSWLGYSKLDEYLMGLRRPEEVPGFFYVEDSFFEPSRAPQDGVDLVGPRIDVEIEQVIAAEGPRVPSAATARRVFPAAFVLLMPEGETPTAAMIQKVNRYRNNLSTFFRRSTSERGRIVSNLRLRPAGAVVGQEGGEEPAGDGAPAAGADASTGGAAGSVPGAGEVPPAPSERPTGRDVIER